MKENILFLDESGDHILEGIREEYPIFVLGGIIVDKEYYENTFEKTVKEFKRNFFNNDGVILHTSEITRNKGDFAVLKDSEIRKKFYKEINLMMESLEYTVIAVVIKKKEFVVKYQTPKDPYFVSLKYILERFVYFLEETKSEGYIYIEKRDKILDNLLMKEIERIFMNGTEFLNKEVFSEKIKEIQIKDKKENIIGLQIADLVVSPIGRFVLGKNTHEDFKIIEKKFRKNPSNGSYIGYGLKIFP